MATEVSPASTSRIPTLLAGIAGCIALVAAGFALYLWGQQPKIAYIETARLMEQYDGAVAAQQELQAQQEAWQANVQTLQAEAEALGQSMMQGNHGQSKMQAIQDSLNAKYRQIARYQRAVETKSQELQRELLEPVYTELNAQMEAFGEAEGYDLILGTVAGGNILYAQEATDVTDAFLRYVEGEGSSVTPPGDSTSATLGARR